MTRTALWNMVRAGDACKVSSVRVRGVRRPVPVYGRAVRAEDNAARDMAPMQTLMAAWFGGMAVAAESRFPAYA